MRRRRRKALPQDPIILDIEKLSHEGRGIAHLADGKVVFVDEALPGEQVSAIYTSKRENFDEVKTQEVIKASTDRVNPECEYASICGGCSLQHFESSAQLAFKDSVLHEKLEHSIGRQDYQKMSALTGPVFGYRRKARLAVRYVHKKEQVLVGFREKANSFITNMDSCAVLDKQVSALIPVLAQLIRSLKSYQHIPQIEVAVGDKVGDANSCALVFRHLQMLPPSDLKKFSDFAEEHCLDLYLQSAGLASVVKHYPPDSEARLHYQLPDYNLTMAFHPMDFTQVNADINHSMLASALELLDLKKTDKVLDLFCGLGNFTLPMATKAASVVGVEGSDEMVLRGNENAQKNELTNCSFYCADLFKPVAGMAWLNSDYDKILLDPPRSGALEVLKDVTACKPERIVYISCNPATLARDAAQLEEFGYQLTSAGVMDMFPQTTHVESIALFLPKK